MCCYNRRPLGRCPKASNDRKSVEENGYDHLIMDNSSLLWSSDNYGSLWMENSCLICAYIVITCNYMMNNYTLIKGAWWASSNGWSLHGKIQLLVWGAALMISRAVENPCIARLRSWFGSFFLFILEGDWKAIGRRLEGDWKAIGRRSVAMKRGWNEIWEPLAG